MQTLPSIAICSLEEKQGEAGRCMVTILLGWLTISSTWDFVSDITVNSCSITFLSLVCFSTFITFSKFFHQHHKWIQKSEITAPRFAKKIVGNYLIAWTSTETKVAPYHTKLWIIFNTGRVWDILDFLMIAKNKIAEPMIKRESNSTTSI